MLLAAEEEIAELLRESTVYLHRLGIDDEPRPRLVRPCSRRRRELPVQPLHLSDDEGGIDRAGDSSYAILKVRPASRPADDS